jgi:hypothetical protein
MRQLFTTLAVKDNIIRQEYFPKQSQLQQPPNTNNTDNFFGEQKPEYKPVGLTIENADMPILNMPTIEQVVIEEQPSIRHEGLDRRINTIYISHMLNYQGRGKLRQELVKIGEENGFSVQGISTNDIWVEDHTIRLHNGKVYIPNRTVNIARNLLYDNGNAIIGPRIHISDIPQGAVAQRPNSVNQYIDTIPEENRVYGLSYLEGGNVLNCRLADGSPGAVIGTESIDFTMRAMELEDTPENKEIAKAQIAKDLELPEANITYIPQFDFHIDMWFRPLQNGVMAVPDFSGGLSMLTEILASSDITSDEKIKLEILKDGLLVMEENTRQFITGAEENLHSAGYKTIKIPCFSVLESAYPKDFNYKLVPQVNFMNGVGGTNAKGETYYITNTSDIPELNRRIEQYFKEQAHIDNIYFVHSNGLLPKQGGFDCVTQEN